MRRSHIISLTFCVVGLLCSLASASIIVGDPANPVSVTLADVIKAGGISVGDKLFTDWSVTSNKLGNGVAPDATAISVTPVIRVNPANPLEKEIGLRFDGLWSAGAMQLADSTIIYKVSVTADDQRVLIKDNTLQMSAFGAANGGLVTISESVFLTPPDTTPSPSIARKFVFFDSTTGAEREIDHKEFADATGAPVFARAVWVVKDVGANGGVQAQGVAKISSFYQTFSQIPEPATLSLLVIGGLMMLRRRR